MYMDARDKSEFAAEEVFFNLARMKNEEGLSIGDNTLRPSVRHHETERHG
jgi:hypothetical protein